MKLSILNDSKDLDAAIWEFVREICDHFRTVDRILFTGSRARWNGSMGEGSNPKPERRRWLAARKFRLAISMRNKIDHSVLLAPFLTPSSEDSHVGLVGENRERQTEGGSVRIHHGLSLLSLRGNIGGLRKSSLPLHLRLRDWCRAARGRRWVLRAVGTEAGRRTPVLPERGSRTRTSGW